MIALLVQITLSLLLLVGSLFVLLGAFSLIKLSEFFKRLHGPTKASTLGVGCVLAASVGYHAFLGTDPQPRELLITVFLFITAPISAHLMAKAALSLRMQDHPQMPEKQLGTPLPPRPDAAPAADVISGSSAARAAASQQTPPAARHPRDG